jgi:hypothetical protein
MTLTIEDNGRIHTMVVSSFGKTGLKQEALPAEVSGIRLFNTIDLKDKYFNDFIDAMMIDDFEAMKAIIEALIDFNTMLPYFKNVKRVTLPKRKDIDYF